MISPGPEEFRAECLITDATFPALESGEPYRTDDGLLVTADGQLVPISLVVTPMLSDSGVMGAVLVFRDISHQKQVERERLHTEGLLRRIQAGLSELAKNAQVYGGNLQDAFQTVTRVAAECLHAERVSIWFFTQDRSAIRLCGSLSVGHSRTFTGNSVDGDRLSEILPRNWTLNESLLPMMRRRIRGLSEFTAKYLGSTRDYLHAGCAHSIGRPDGWRDLPRTHRP